jgi:hypothetical protein
MNIPSRRTVTKWERLTAGVGVRIENKLSRPGRIHVLFLAGG